MHPSRPSRGFTLIELVVVIAILAILAGVIVPRVSHYMAVARDRERLADIRNVRAAIEQFHHDKGRYPRPDENPAFGGWDVSHEDGFIPELRENGYLSDEVVDPVNDATYHYRYFVYTAGSFGCKGDGDFYVLGILNFESEEFAKRNRGFFLCSDRDWSREFAYATGGGASFRQ